MNSEDLLCELENEIDGDWEDIQESIRRKKSEEKYKEEIEYLKDHPVRMNFPEFHRFYELILEIYIHCDNLDMSSRPIGALREIIGRMFSIHGNNPKMAPEFEYIWSMLCDPRKTLFNAVECRYCKSTWNMIVERNDMMSFPIDAQRNGYALTEETMNINRIMCPNCGNTMATTTNKIKGIFKYKNITKEQSNDDDFIRQYLEERGNGFR